MKAGCLRAARDRSGCVGTVKNFLAALKSDWSKRILFRYASAYALAVVVVLLLLIPIRSEMYRMNYDAIISDAHERMDAGTSMFESTASMMCNSAKMLTESEAYTQLRKWSGRGNASLAYPVNEAREMLYNFIFMREEYVNGAYVVFNNNELFVANFGTALSYQDIYPEFMEYEGKTVEAWYGDIFSTTNILSILPEQIVTSRYKEYFDGAASYVTCAVHPWNEQNYGTRSAICFLLDTHTLLSSFVSDEIYESGYVCIRDSDGGLIAQHGEERLTTDFVLLSGRQASEYITVTVGVPDSLIREQIASITAILKICIYLGLFSMLILLGGILLMHNISAYRVFSISSEYADIPLSAAKRMRAYDYVKESIASITASKNAAERKMILLQSNWNNEAVLNACQRGTLTTRERDHVSRLLGSISERFVILLMEFGGGGGVVWIEEYARAHLHCAIVSFYLDENTVALIVPIDESDAIGHVLEMIGSLCEVSRMRYAAVPNVGVSQIHAQVNGLNTAFEQARMAMRVHSMNAQKDYVLYDRAAVGEVEPYIGMDVLAKLTDLVLMGESMEVAQLFDEMQTVHLSAADKASRYTYVFSAVRMALLNASKVIVKDGGFTLPEFWADDDAADTIEKYRESALTLCEQVHARRRSSNTVLKQSIGDYITQHFHEPNLSGDQIAQAFGLSRTYVLQFMRTQFGKTLSEYIEDVRMEHIERWLVDTDWTVEKIMEESGYTSQNTMYRAFRKKHGVTPGKWRDAFREWKE